MVYECMGKFRDTALYSGQQLSSNFILGYVLAFCSIICWSASAVAVQLLEAAVPDFQLSAYRYATQLLVCGLMLCSKGVNQHFSSDRVPLVVLMCISNLLFNVFFFSASTILPLAHTMASFIIACMIFTGLLTKFVVRSKIGLTHGLSLLMASVGVVFIYQPWRTFGSGFIPPFLKIDNNTSDSLQVNLSNVSTISDLDVAMTNNTGPYMTAFSVAFIVAMGTVLSMLAGLAVAIHMLTVGIYLADFNPVYLALLPSVANIPTSILLSLYLEQPVFGLDGLQIILLLVHCVGSALDVICTNAAAQKIKPSHVILIQSFMVVILLLTQDVLHDGLSGRRNPLEVIGCSVVTLSIVMNTITAGLKQFHEDLGES